MLARPDPLVTAKWIQNRFGVRLPVRPHVIARELGIEVVSRPLSPGVSGCLLPEYQGRRLVRYSILVNARHSEERRAFSVAHELGHYCLHRKMRRTFVCGPWLRNIYEQEANSFAAELLMPTELVRRLAPHMAFTALAATFGVSYTALDMRLRELGTMCA